MFQTQEWLSLLTDRNASLINEPYQTVNGVTYIFGFPVIDRNSSIFGVMKGESVEHMLDSMLSVKGCRNFRSLPIPFRCVTADIRTAQEVILSKGPVSKAMRASMSIPGIFKPVKLDDRLLVDGGMRNNYPVDIAREMGADIVIGVTLSGKKKTSEELTGTMSIVGQIIDMNCLNKYEENIAISDLHMNVDPRSYSTASFSSAAVDSLVRYGEEEAMKHWDEIIALKKRIGIDETFRPTILHPLRPNVMTERQRVNSYTFENMTPQDERFIRQKFHLQKVDSIDAELELQLTTSMRVDLFYNTAECRLVPDGNGVRVILSAGSRRSMQLHAGVRFDSEENAAVLLCLDLPLKTSIPINTDLMLRLVKVMMVR